MCKEEKYYTEIIMLISSSPILSKYWMETASTWRWILGWDKKILEHFYSQT